MKHELVRCDLDRCYRFNEYNETIAFAKEHIEVNGIREEAKRLEEEKDIYIRDVETITKPEKEQENKKYAEWEICVKAGRICKWISVGALICFPIALISSLPEWISMIFLLFFYSIYIALPAFIIAKIAAWTCGIVYSQYTSKIMEKVNARNNSFAAQARVCGEKIDTLYLSSLDPVLRETVLMRREQAEHNKKNGAL